MAGATEQSYPTTRLSSTSVSYGNIVCNAVRRAATDQNAGHAIVGRCYACDREVTTINREDTRTSKLLNDSRTVNRGV